MTACRIFAPPPARQPAAIWLVLAIAVLAAAALLANFVDALHVSMERGETMRAAHRVVPPMHFDSGTPILVALAPLQRAKR